VLYGADPSAWFPIIHPIPHVNPKNSHYELKVIDDVLINDQFDSNACITGIHTNPEIQAVIDWKKCRRGLKVIDRAFGETSDLYKDVLQVPVYATENEVGLAVFWKRSELFLLLEIVDTRPDYLRLERCNIEKKIDAVLQAQTILLG
jgi:hypothetical protein